MTLLEQFGLFIASYPENLSAPDEHAARRALLDWQAALIAGSDSAVAEKLIASYATDLGHGPCSVAGSSSAAGLRVAAYLNGTISHIAEFDDIYRNGAYHPAAPTISAVFSLAQARGLSLSNLLRAITLGYEVSTRIAEVIQPSHYQFYHTTGTVGVFGAAAACAALLQLDEKSCAHALATAATFASGLQQAFRSDAMTKPMHAGHAAEVGLHAALTAAQGMTGALDILEGVAGFGAAMSSQPRWDELFFEIGKTSRITQMTFKNHGCCGHTFAAIDGAMYLIKQHAIDYQKIRRVRVGAYQATLDVCAYRHPTSAFEAKFSLSHTVACGILYGAVREKSVQVERLDQELIRSLEDRIELVLDPQATALFPKVRSAKIAIELLDGQVFEHHQLTRHGDPDDPLTDDELLSKFLELSAVRIGPDRSNQLAEIIMQHANPLISELSSRWHLVKSLSAK
jgi:2-methylcitrate dehydratase PrpD